MTQREDDFAAVLERLHGVREELAATSSPDKVAGLRDLGQQLVAQGERLLGLLESAPAAAAAALAARAPSAGDDAEPAVGSVGAPLVPVGAPAPAGQVLSAQGATGQDPAAAQETQVLAVHPERREGRTGTPADSATDPTADTPTAPVDAPTQAVDAPTQVLRTGQRPTSED